jgi:RimJ/RimL family protein N-acetyltransferase
MPVLRTDRLLLRPFEEEDLDEYAAIMADPEVTRYLGSEPMDRSEAWRSMAVFLGHERLRGWSNNAVVEVATGRLLGRCGLGSQRGGPVSRSGGRWAGSPGERALPPRLRQCGGTGPSRSWPPASWCR